MLLFWLGLPSWSNFLVLQKVMEIMLASSTSGLYRNDFVVDNFSANDYNMVVSVIIAMRSFFRHQVCQPVAYGTMER